MSIQYNIQQRTDNSHVGVLWCTVNIFTVYACWGFKIKNGNAMHIYTCVPMCSITCITMSVLTRCEWALRVLKTTDIFLGGSNQKALWPWNSWYCQLWSLKLLVICFNSIHPLVDNDAFCCLSLGFHQQMSVLRNFCQASVPEGQYLYSITRCQHSAFIIVLYAVTTFHKMMNWYLLQ